MKKNLPNLLVLTLFLFHCSYSYSQLSNLRSQQSYRLKIGRWLPIYDPSRPAGERVSSTTKLVLDTYSFNLIAQADNGYIIRFLPFVGSGTDSLNNAYVTANRARDVQRFFYLSKEDWDNIVEQRLKATGTTFGIMNVPMKIRPKNGHESHRKRYLEFEGNVNLGLSFANYLRLGDDVMIYYVGGLSVTQIRVDQTNTNGYTTQAESRGGFGYYVGYIYQNKGFQISALIGWDYAAGEVSEYWVYQGKPWIGIGLGIGLFSPDITPVKSNKK